MRRKIKIENNQINRLKDQEMRLTFEGNLLQLYALLPDLAANL